MFPRHEDSRMLYKPKWYQNEHRQIYIPYLHQKIFIIDT